MLSEEQIKHIEDELSGDEPIEDTYRQLREDGHSRLEAVRALLKILDLSLTEAKTILLTNDTWDDARSATSSQTEPSPTNRDDGGPPPPAPAD